MSKIIGFRVPKKERQLIEKACNDKKEDLSDFMRQAVRAELTRLGYLQEAEKKQLKPSTEAPLA